MSHFLFDLLINTYITTKQYKILNQQIQKYYNLIYTIIFNVDNILDHLSKQKYKDEQYYKINYINYIYNYINKITIPRIQQIIKS